MPITNDSLNKDLYRLLKVRGFDPIPKDSEGETTPVPDDADVFRFTFKRNERPMGSAWITVDSNQKLIIYFNDDINNADAVAESDNSLSYDDSWTGFLKTLKMWAQRRQLGFEIQNQDHLASDMAQRTHMKKKENISENKITELAKWRQGYSASGHPAGYKHKSGDVGPVGGTFTDEPMGYGDTKKVPVNKYRDEPDQLAGRSKTSISTTGKPLQKKNAQRNLKAAIKQSAGKHGPVGVLPENEGVAEGSDYQGQFQGQGQQHFHRLFAELSRSIKDRYLLQNFQSIASILSSDLKTTPDNNYANQVQGWLQSIGEAFTNRDLKSIQNLIKQFEAGLGDRREYVPMIIKQLQSAAQIITNIQNQGERVAGPRNSVPTRGMTAQQGVAEGKNMTTRKIQMDEGYYPMGKQASYSDAIPTVKIVLQHTRQIQEGEQRYRNIARIFLENTQGERILCPVSRPGMAQVFARHLAEGGVPNDERWNHIKSLCEEYNKMAGFARAVKNGQFNESAQRLVEAGLNHFLGLRESLGKMRGHRGYNAYFESWTPTLMENEGEETNLNELFVQETLDPRIESVMPILSKLKLNLGEMKEVDELAEWANNVTEDEGRAALNPVGIPEGEEGVAEGEIEDGQAAHDKINTPASLRKAKGGDWKVTGSDLEKSKSRTGTSPEGLAAIKKLAGVDQAVSESASNQELVNSAETMTLEQFVSVYGEENENIWHEVNGEPDDDSDTGYDPDDPKHPTWMDRRQDQYDYERDRRRDMAIDKDVEESFIGGLVKNVKRLATDKDIKSRVGQEIAKSHEALMKGDTKTARKHFNRFDKLDNLANKEQGVAEGLGESVSFREMVDVVDEHYPKYYAKLSDSDISDKQFEQEIIDAYKKIMQKQGVAEGSTSKEKQKTPYRNINSPAARKAADAQREKMAKDQSAKPGKELLDRIKKKDVDEGLDANQKRVGQLGPTEKVGPKGAVGKLVGANESIEHDPLLDLKRLLGK